MNKVAIGERGMAGESTSPQPSAGSEQVLACSELLAIEPVSAPTTICKINGR
jgi:hypothetical protein